VEVAVGLGVAVLVAVSSAQARKASASNIALSTNNRFMIPPEMNPQT
jgi:hypothetical protein